MCARVHEGVSERRIGSRGPRWRRRAPRLLQMESDLASILCVAKLERLVERCQHERLEEWLRLYEADKETFWRHFKDKVGSTKIGERLALASALKKALAQSKGGFQWRQGFLAADRAALSPPAQDEKKRAKALPNEAYLPTETCALIDDVDEDEGEDSDGDESVLANTAQQPPGSSSNLSASPPPPTICRRPPPPIQPQPPRPPPVRSTANLLAAAIDASAGLDGISHDASSSSTEAFLAALASGDGQHAATLTPQQAGAMLSLVSSPRRARRRTPPRPPPRPGRADRVLEAASDQMGLSAAARMRHFRGRRRGSSSARVR